MSEETDYSNSIIGGLINEDKTHLQTLNGRVPRGLWMHSYPHRHGYRQPKIVELGI